MQRSFYTYIDENIKLAISINSRYVYVLMTIDDKTINLSAANRIVGWADMDDYCLKTHIRRCIIRKYWQTKYGFIPDGSLLSHIRRIKN